MKRFLEYAAYTLFIIALTVACSKDGNGTDPFGNNDPLVGNWTSISATGTVGYTGYLGNSLANAVNQSMNTYNLTNVIVFRFEANGKLTMYDMGELYGNGTWSMKGNTFTITNTQGQSSNMNIALNGDEFTLGAGGTEIAELIAWAIGNVVLKNNGYGGMTEAAVEVSQADLTIKFNRQI